MKMCDDNTWFANIAVLELFDPNIAWLLVDFYKRYSQRSGHESEGVSLQAESLAELQAGHYILFGIGQGASLATLLSRGDVDVLVIEPDLGLIVDVLHSYDMSAAIQSGRLRLLAPLLGNAVLAEIETRRCLVYLQTYIQEMAGNLIWINTGSRYLHDIFFVALEQALVTWEQQFQKISVWLSKTYNFIFDVTVVSPSCAIFDDLASSFKRLGFNVRLCRIPDVAGEWTQQQYHDLWQELIMQPSQVTIMRNRALLETIDCKQRLALESVLPGRLVSWWWDVPNVATHIDFDDPQTQLPAFAFSREILNQLPKLSQWLPPAARQDFVSAGASEPQFADIPVTFVGQSRYALVLNHINVLTQAFSYFSEDQVSTLLKDIQSRQTDVIEQFRFLNEHWQQFKQAIDNIRSRAPHIAYFLSYILRMLQAGLFRLAGVKLLLDHDVQLKVYGDSDWLASGIVTQENFCGTIDPKDLPALYQRSQVNLNFNFMQSASTVNPKVLDIAACGAVVLTDYKPELEILYPDSSTRPFVFHDLDELPLCVNRLLALDLHDYRQRLRQYTASQHSILQRAQILAEVLTITPAIDDQTNSKRTH